MGSVIGKRKRTLLLSTLVVVILFLAFRFTTSKNSGKNIQDVLQSIPNDKLLGLSRLLTETGAKEDTLILKKLLKAAVLQEERLKLLELQNTQLLRAVKELKHPSPHASLRGKLVITYPYDPSVKFPAYIWQLWKHGLNDERFDPDFLEGERQWAGKNPGFVHELFNDDTAHAFVRFLYDDIPEVIQAYELLPELVLKMDFFRYLILFAKGGVYADIDTIPFQPIPNWIPEKISPGDVGLIVGVDHDMSTDKSLSEDARRMQFGQFVCQAKPGHPVLREVIARITEITLAKAETALDGKDLQDLPPGKSPLRLEGVTAEQVFQSVSRWTGSALFTDNVFRYLNDWIQSAIFNKVTWRDFHKIPQPKLVSDVLVMPVRAFATTLKYPPDGKVVDPLAFVKHYRAGAWYELLVNVPSLQGPDGKMKKIGSKNGGKKIISPKDQKPQQDNKDQKVAGNKAQVDEKDAKIVPAEKKDIKKEPAAQENAQKKEQKDIKKDPAAQENARKQEQKDIKKDPNADIKKDPKAEIKKDNVVNDKNKKNIVDDRDGAKKAANDPPNLAKDGTKPKEDNKGGG